MKYTREALTEAAANSTSIAGVLRYLGIKWSGGAHHHISRRLRMFGVDTSHFTGGAHNKGKEAPRRRAEDILVPLPADSPRAKRHMLLRAMREIGIPERCALCGIGPYWHDRPLTLHIDHVNGDFLDNRPANVRFLCPNCHSQTETFAGKRRRGMTQRGVDCAGLTPPGSRGPVVPSRDRLTYESGVIWSQDELE